MLTMRPHLFSIMQGEASRGRKLRNRRNDLNARVIDENVEATKFGYCHVDHFGD